MSNESDKNNILVLPLTINSKHGKVKLQTKLPKTNCTTAMINLIKYLISQTLHQLPSIVFTLFFNAQMNRKHNASSMYINYFITIYSLKQSKCFLQLCSAVPVQSWLSLHCINSIELSGSMVQSFPYLKDKINIGLAVFLFPSCYILCKNSSWSVKCFDSIKEGVEIMLLIQKENVFISKRWQSLECLVQKGLKCTSASVCALCPSRHHVRRAGSKSGRCCRW